MSVDEQLNAAAASSPSRFLAGLTKRQIFKSDVAFERTMGVFASLCFSESEWGLFKLPNRSEEELTPFKEHLEEYLATLNGEL